MVNTLAESKPRRYRVGFDTTLYYRRLMKACIVTLLLGVGATAALCCSYFMDRSNQVAANYETRISALVEEHEKEVTVLQKELDGAAAEERKKTAELQEQYDELLRIHQEQQNLSSADFSLLRKYWYVLKDAPNDGSITLDTLRYADEQCKKWNLNPHWLWHIYQHESHWTASIVNTRSGATGIGQVMPSTGRWYWENVLGHETGSFQTSMLKDPMVNIEITTAHLGRDMEAGLTWKQAVEHYCGGGVDTYWGVVVNYGASHGINLTADNWYYPES